MQKSIHTIKVKADIILQYLTISTVKCFAFVFWGLTTSLDAVKSLTN